jgi:hypothetical protein
MQITKSYIEGVKQRIELVKKAYTDDPNLPPASISYHTANLLDYLETIENFVEEEKKMTCEICSRPLYTRKDGSLVCVEMKH